MLAVVKQKLTGYQISSFTVKYGPMAAVWKWSEYEAIGQERTA